MNDKTDVRKMPVGQDHQFTVGEKVYIEVDDVNSPTGLWEGEVTFAAEKADESNGYRRVRAKITDPKVNDYRNMGHGWYFDREPMVNYTVYPFDTVTVRLFERIAVLEARLQANAVAARTREDAYMRALVGLSEGLAEKKAKEAYERGLQEARTEAEKRIKAEKARTEG